MPTHISGETSTRYPAHLSADQLDCAHQRIGEEQRPAHAVAELRAGLGIGGDAAGVVVRSAGDQAGSHDVPPARPLRLLDRLGRRSDRHIHDSLRLRCNVLSNNVKGRPRFRGQRQNVAEQISSATRLSARGVRLSQCRRQRGRGGAPGPRASKQDLTLGLHSISAESTLCRRSGRRASSPLMQEKPRPRAPPSKPPSAPERRKECEPRNSVRAHGC